MKKRPKKTGKKGKLFVSFVLDETGSMISCKEQTIGGFNEYIKGLQNKGNDILFTLTKFNTDKIDIIHDSVDIKDVLLLNDDTYIPAACTPLYDAIGRTVRSLEKETKGKKGGVLMVIQTDGLENASKEYTRDGIFNLITEKKKDGWTFAFLGADQDAWATSQFLGISKGNTLSYGLADTRRTISRLSGQTMSYSAHVESGNLKPFERFFKEEGDDECSDNS